MISTGMGQGGVQFVERVTQSIEDAKKVAAETPTLAETLTQDGDRQFKDFANSLKNAISGAIGKAQSALEGLAPKGILDDFSSVFEPGANGPFENIYRALDVAVHGSASQWAEVLGLTQENARQIVNDFRDGIMSEGVLGLIDVEGFAGIMREQVQREQMGKSLTEAFIADVAAQAGVSQAAVAEALGPMLGASFEPPDGAGASYVNSVADDVSRNAGKLSDTGGQLAGTLADGMEAEATAISSAGKAAKDQWDETQTVIMDAINDMDGGITSFLDDVKTNVNDAWVYVTEKTTLMTESVRQLITTMVEQVILLITNMTTQVKLLINDMVLQVVFYITTMVTSVLSLIDNMRMNAIVIVTNMTNTIISAVGTMASEVEWLVNQMADAVRNTLKELNEDTYDSGKKFVEAFAEGIRDNMDVVTDAVEDMASAISKRLPSSDAETGPLSNLTNQGRALGETLAGGMWQTANLPIDVITDMVRRLVRMLDEIGPELKKAAKAGDLLSRAMRPWAEAAKAIDALAKYTFRHVDSAADNLSAQMEMLARKMSAMAERAGPKILEAAAKAADYMGRVVAVWKPGVDAIDAISKFRLVDVGQAADRILEQIYNLAVKLRDWAQALMDVGDLAEFADALSEFIRSIVDMVNEMSELEQLANIFDEGYEIGRSWIDGIMAGINSGITELQDLLDYVIGLFGDAGQSSQANQLQSTMTPQLNGMIAVPLANQTYGNYEAAPNNETVVNITINNPTGEPTNESVMRALRQLAAVGLLDPVVTKARA